MGNRFGVKDFVQIALLVVLIVTVWLSMKQRDREFVLLQGLQQQGTEQTRDFASIRKLLTALVNAPPAFAPAPAPPSTGPVIDGGGHPTIATQPTATVERPAFGDPFKYVKIAQAEPDYAAGDWFIDNFGTKVPKLTPLISSDVYQTIVENRVLEGLAYVDPNTLEHLPLLSTGWQIKDNSIEWEKYVQALRDKGLGKEEIDQKLESDPQAPVPVEILFKLRKGVTFSDGEPFSADDVVFTFNWIMNPKVQAPRARAYFQKIRKVEKVDDSTVVFKFREPYFEAFDLAAGMTIMPRHFYARYTPEQFNQNPGLLMGTGPYRLRNPAGWHPGDAIELFRNERYWGESPAFEKLVFPQVETDAAELTMFKNGETDYFGATPEQYRLLLKDKDLLKRTNHWEVESSLSGYAYVAWNQKRKGETTRFADPRVRRAMTLLTNRQRIVDEVMLGYATVATGPFTKLGKPQIAPGLEPWPYDPKEAKKLLRDAGYEDRDNDGVIEDRDGVPFAFKLTYPSNNETYTRVMLFLKDTYAQAGIKVELDPVDWPNMIKKLDERNFDAISLRWSGGPETDIYQMFHSDQIKDNGDNFMSYSNPQLDELIDKARSTVDEARRMPLWQQTSRILHEDQPYTFLYNQKALVWMDNRVKNVHPSKLGLNYAGRLNMPNPWYVPMPLRKWGK